MSKKLNRRKFFGLTAITALGTAVFAKSPLKFFDKANKIRINKQVKIHSSAVKRINKV
jgi:hypothetical protein